MMGVNTRAEHLRASKLINLYVFGPDSSIYKSKVASQSAHQFCTLCLVILKKYWLNLSASRLPRAIIHGVKEEKSSRQAKIVGKIGFYYLQAYIMPAKRIDLIPIKQKSLIYNRLNCKVIRRMRHRKMFDNLLTQCGLCVYQKYKIVITAANPVTQFTNNFL